MGVVNDRRSSVPARAHWRLLRVAVAVAAILVPAVAAAQDTVVFANGDRLSGTFLDVNGDTVDLHTSLGHVSIPVKTLSSVSVGSPVVIVLKKGIALRGVLALTPSHDWQVTDDQGQSTEADPSTIQAIMPASSYDALVATRPPIWRGWTGTGSIGYSLQRGEQNTSSLGGSLDTTREPSSALVFRPHWRTNAHSTLVLSNATATGASIAADTLNASARQDFFVAPGNFIFGIAQFDHVGNEGLALRQTYGGGLGYDLKKSAWGTVSLFGGLTSVRERFTTGARGESAQLLIGEKFRLQLASRVQVNHTLNAYPNVSIFGRYHFDTNTSVDVKLNERFSLNVGLIDLYLTNPPAGSQRNSFALTTGLAATF